MSKPKYWSKEAMEFLVTTTVKALGISELAARLRIEAMFKSGVLDKFDSAENPLFQYTVDVAVRIPQSGNESGHFD